MNPSRIGEVTSYFIRSFPIYGLNIVSNHFHCRSSHESFGRSSHAGVNMPPYSADANEHWGVSNTTSTLQDICPSTPCSHTHQLCVYIGQECCISKWTLHRLHRFTNGTSVWSGVLQYAHFSGVSPCSRMAGHMTTPAQTCRGINVMSCSSSCSMCAIHIHYIYMCICTVYMYMYR